ncbi:MAG TPA: hypothetical protein VK893_01630, partial [Pyrinomonadaceae bacterium]|nr:hypothetical protein [Pyrinomonadaceae bacterium]
MIGWLRPLLMIFYAPVRGMREMRDRASLAPVAFLAFLSQVAYNFVTRKFAVVPGVGTFPEVFHAAMIVVLVALILVPILTLVANTFERRGSFRVVLTQEYAAVAATMFYVLIAANIVAILIVAALHYSGLQAQLVADMIQNSDQTRAMLPDTPEFAVLVEQFKDPAIVSYSLILMFQRALLGVGIILGVKDAFRMSTLRAL